MDQFRLEFARLSSSRLAIEQNQRDFDEAMEEYDAFMNQYASSLNEIKIGIKVFFFVFIFYKNHSFIFLILTGLKISG